QDTIGYDTAVKTNILRHGNWDSLTAGTGVCPAGNTCSNGVVWSNAISNQSLPISLYLTQTSQPSWWITGLAWPPFGPDGSTINNKIPAQVRYEGGTVPTPTAPTITA